MCMLTERPRVLVADDHAELSKAVCRMLSLECEVVGTVSDGGALMEAAERLRPDIIVLDVNLRDVNGLEACRQLTQLNPGTKVIMFTAMDDPEVVERSFELGASAFVSKASSHGDLLATVRRLCADGH